MRSDTVRSGRAARAAGLLAASACACACACAVPLEAGSADGQWHLVADGMTITLLDATRRAVKVHAGAALDGSHRSAVAAIFDAGPRRSFVLAFVSLPELWEISYDPQAEPIYPGLVHDYRQREGTAEPGFLNPRRTLLDVPLRALTFDSSHAFVLGRAPDHPDGRAVLHLVQLDVRKRIAEFVQTGRPDTSKARRVQREGRELIEVPDEGGAVAAMIDPRAARLAAPSTH